MQEPAKAADHYTPYLQLITFHDVAWPVFRIFRFQYQLLSALSQTLDTYISVHRRDDDMPRHWIQLAVHHHHVFVENTDAGHAVTRGLNEIGMRSVHLHQLIQR